MPCNAVTQQTARAAVPTALILDNATAIEALAGELTKLFGAPVKVGANDWRIVFGCRDLPQEPYEGLTGAQSLFFCSETASAEVRRTGEIVLRQGWWSYNHRTPPDRLQGQLSQLVNLVNGLLFQNQVRTLIAQQARITGEQRASNGALVLSVEL